MAKPVLIIGGGLVGSLLATRLAQSGQEVLVFEKRPDPRTVSTEGRSINLALSHRGIQALKAANVFDDLANDLIPMHGRMMHDLDGAQTFQSYGKEGQFINSVSRIDLNSKLISAAESHGASFFFEHDCTAVDFEKTTVTFGQGVNKYKHQGAVIFGTDGAFSAVRSKLKDLPEFTESVDFISHSYKELRLESKDGDFQFEPNYLHIWPRGKHMLIALPNPDRSFTCTLFLDTEKMKGLYDANLHEFFEENFPDFSALIDNLEPQFRANPIGSLVTVKCSPWSYNNTMLLGDSAHAIVPFYGQGMNAGFEDTRILMDELIESDFNWNEVVNRFSNQRKKDADAIANLALKNFVEMRDWVADDSFLKRKKIESELNERFPEKWIPQYSMVTFSDMPYSEAERLGKMQDQIMSETNLHNPDFNDIINRFESLKSSS